jgi:glycosyltransferase involved in cell wall biosynthesis
MARSYNISVIMPCFNHGEFLAEAVSSVTTIKRDDIELVVVDDGSTDDGTRREVDRLSGQGIKIIRQENKGLAAARNAGVLASQGEYLFPLDADDRMRAGWIDRGMEILDSQPEVGVVYGDTQFFGTQTELWEPGPLDADKLLEANYICCSGLYRRLVWEQNGGYDGAMPVQGYEDWDFWVGAVERGWEFAYLPEVLFDYRKAERSMLTHAEKFKAQVDEFMVKKHRRLYRYWKLRRVYRDIRFRVKHPIAQALRRFRGTEHWQTK